MKKREPPHSLQTQKNKTGNICVSIITPVSFLLKDRKLISMQIEKAVHQAKMLLRNSYDNNIATPLSDAIDELSEQIDYLHRGTGIGFFVSGHAKALIHFNFPVTEKVTIDHAFQVKELIYESYYDVSYAILALGKNETRLYTARLDNITEIIDKHFPQKRDVLYEYSGPPRGGSYTGNSSLKEFEKDKIVMDETRVSDFFRETDNVLSNYITNETLLVITGDRNDLLYYKTITAYNKQIACEIPGSHISLNPQELGPLAWKNMLLYLNKCKRRVIDDFEEKIGEGKGVTGLENIWRTVLEDRCYRLLVEKDYSVKGYLVNDRAADLRLDVPDEPHTIVADVVNDLILNALDKKAEVIVFDYNTLKDHNRLGLITRY